jgi:PAS domain S-box-containing protein
VKWREALRGKGYDIEHRIIADGQIKWVRERAELEFEKDGTLLGGFGTVTDITRRKQMEDELREAKYGLEIRVKERTSQLTETVTALRQSEERYRSLTAATTQIIWTTNASGEVVDDIPSWREFTGQSFEEIKGWGWIDALHPDDREGTARIWSDSVKNRTLYETEYRMRRCDGEYRNMFVRGVPVLEEDGSVREWVGTCTDITEQERAESRQNVTKSLLELFAREDSRKAYLDSAVKIVRDWSGCEFVGIRIRDDKGNIPYESYVGFDNDFLALENALNLDRDNCLCIRTILEKPEKQEQKFITDGGSFYCNDSEAFFNSLTEKQRKKNRDNCVKWGFKSISVVPIRYRDKVMGAIHIADLRKDKVLLPKIQFIETTITPLIGEAVQRFKAEEELEKYRQHLEDEVKSRTEDLARSNRDLEQFAYVASHDLQEPLRAVSGFVGLLRTQLRDSLDAKKLEYMNFATSGVERMQALISGLLEYSRVGTGGKQPEQTDSNAALGRAIAHLGGGIKEFGAKISSDNLPTVYVDPVQLSQVFQNLIGNAIKFCNNEAPLVHISASRQDREWRFAVADNGIGIEPQYTERIFQIFQRLHSREKYPGTGMGLSLCKKIVERHGGRIWVESKPGAGSTFYFTIPDKKEDV